MVPSELVEVTETVCTLTWRWSSRHSCPLFVQRDAPHNGGAKLLGGPGSGPLILAHPGGPATSP
jgi:hypothetical protein